MDGVGCLKVWYWGVTGERAARAVRAGRERGGAAARGMHHH